MGGCRDCSVRLLGACHEDYCREEREALIENAVGIAEAHGHALSEFVRIKHHPVWQARCLGCGELARICLDPKPGELDVSGEACETGCKFQKGAAEVDTNTAQPK
jgi:hypothetical protein